MNYSDPYSAGTLRAVFNQFTMDLVDDLKQKSGQTDNTATVVVGVGIGMLVSAAIVCAFWCISRCCPLIARRMRGGPRSGTVSRVVNDVELDADPEYDPQCASPTSATVHNTEGAYRSDSETSDDGEGVKATKEAQRRSRKNGSV